MKVDVDFPNVAARQSFLTQTSDIPLTSVFTPSADGTFRVTAYLVFTTTAFVGTGGSANASLQWTDELQMQNAPLAGIASSGYGQGQLVIHAKAGQPIQISSSYNPGAVSPYNLYIVVIEE